MENSLGQDHLPDLSAEFLEGSALGQNLLKRQLGALQGSFSKRPQVFVFPFSCRKGKGYQMEMNTIFVGKGLLDLLIYFENSDIMTPSMFTCHYFCENSNSLLSVQVCNIKGP